jgi:hypothetical protein
LKINPGVQVRVCVGCPVCVGQKSLVDIAESSIHDYQKNGITANEVGTEVTIEGNFVTGLGPTTGAAQNGIQIGFGAQGTIRHNTVANYLWSPCVSVDSCTATANDILVFHSDGVSVHDNTIGVSQTGVAIVGNGANVFDNVIFNSQVFDGVELIGDHNTTQRNHITQSPSGRAGGGQRQYCARTSSTSLRWAC